MGTWTWQVLLKKTTKLHGTKTWTAKALLEVKRSYRQVRSARSVFAADLTEMGTWTCKCFLSNCMVRKHGQQRHFWKSKDRVDERVVLIVFAADLDGDGDMDLASASEMTTKLHGRKHGRQWPLEVKRAYRECEMLIVYLRLTWMEMETWTCKCSR